MANEDVQYWEAQLEAALDQMGVDCGITARYNAEDIALGNSDWDREQRAHLINALEVRGFTIVSTTKQVHIHVDAPSDRLNHDFEEVDA